MKNSPGHRLLRTETLVAAGLFAVAAGFLVPTSALDGMSALLPAAMLVALMALTATWLVADQRKASAGEASPTMAKAPGRVLGAFLLIILFALCVDFVGFYVSTAVFVPLVAYLFGYRSPLGLVIATAIVLVAIYLIFGFAMAQEFPRGHLGLR